MDGSRRGGSFWASKSGIALCALIAGAAVFLIVEHRAHALDWLPFAILLACPLMHLFMHRASREIVDCHAGLFPRTAAGIAELPGIGRSTAAAIAAFAYGEAGAILDGNVKRVLARHFGAPDRRCWACAPRHAANDGA